MYLKKKQSLTSIYRYKWEKLAVYITDYNNTLFITYELNIKLYKKETFLIKQI